MEDNVALGIRISVTIVLVASLVATVLTLMAIGTSIMGGGQNKLQTTLSQIAQQDLMQYANTTKMGSVVKAIIGMYQTEELAILVKTKALQTTPILNHGDGATNVSDAPISGKGWYFNYGCRLDGTTANTLPDGLSHVMVKGDGVGDVDTDDNIIIRAGVPYLEGVLKVTNGIKDSNYDTAGIVSNINYESILDNGVFYMQLLQNKTGNIIGIVCTQLK